MTKKQSKRLYETPKVLHDAPVENGSTDFHFDDYAATLARLIADKTTETPLAIGVSGSWGAGKTTLLRRVQSMLEPTRVLNDPSKPAVLEFVNPDENPQSAYRACRTVWFNAWKYADEDQLLVALVRVIVQSMADDGIVQKMLGKLLDPAYPRRDVVGTVLGWFSIKVADVGVAVNTGEPRETRFGEKTATLDLFDEAFERLMAAWVHQTLDVKKIDPQKGVLVVFIDDLDRCLPAKTVQVLEAVKLFLDKKGCIFVLGADTEVVRAAVQSHYVNAKVKDENADKYLEKVIQLRFELPPIVPKSMQAYLKEQPRVDAAMHEQWETLIAAAEINPRRVKAVINSVNLLWTMFKNSDPRAASVERADFIRWQAIGQAAPDEFKKRAHDMEPEIRFNFVSDALRWAKGEGDETVNAYFREYEKYTRLRRALREVHFGTGFNAEALEAFIYLVAPLDKPAPVTEKPDVEKTPVQVKTGEAERESAAGESFSISESDLESLKAVTRGGPEGHEASTKPSMGAEPRAGSREGALIVGEMEFMRVPKGAFIMGSKEDEADARDDEKPQHSLEIPYDYWLARFPVTNEQYSLFVKAGSAKHPVSGWEKKPDHPVVNVSWQDAQNYVKWLNETRAVGLPRGCLYRLPSEAEWEKAARGAYGNIYPWGNEFDVNRCNTYKSKKGGTVPVGAYPGGASPYGCEQMAGNVWERIHSLFAKYPYKIDDGREDEQKSGRRVLRGGSFLDIRQEVRAACRNTLDGASGLIGFRVALAPALKG